MSGITTVIVKTGEYNCIECLEEALDRLGFRGKLNVIQEQNSYVISLSEQTQDEIKNRVKSHLNIQLQKFHEQILPIYTEFHAIHSLKEKGFKHVKTYNQEDGYKLIFEKLVGQGNDQRIDRYEITVIASENRILIDGGNMPGDYCRQQSRKFQRSMGKFKSFVPHQSSESTAVKESVKTKQRIGIKRQ